MGVLLGAGMMLGSATPATASSSKACKKVLGTFSAYNLPPEACLSPVGFCTEGKLSGNLKGTYSFVMSAATPAGEPEAPNVTFFQGDSVVTTHKGDVYEAVDTGAINLDPPGTLNSGRFSTLLTFVDGAGGHLWIQGTSDLAAGTVKGVYSGLVCPE
jgi:hypothetical protein